ncbi:hypothetical protein ACFYNO_26415 [Kitasatospora sp. NPDC006697]|uniref:hypothetical protein n=1 Tax=Kitasatospora sp. NPDC006697 TaxID=3364020 RepID=UPI00369677AC
MATHPVLEDPRLLRWQRVREFAVPPTMIKTATARRLAGDWAGACAAARVDVDLDLRAVARRHGQRLAARLRDDLRALAPDLLRWQLPRIAPDGLLRPGLSIALARYPESPLQLVVRTPPAWAGAGQRLSLALWEGSPAGAADHPHPRPNRRYRLDLHRHLWDAGRSGELRTRSGADRPATADAARWPAEAAILLAADGLPPGPVALRLDSRRHLMLDLTKCQAAVPVRQNAVRDLPVLPDAAVRTPPDLQLLRAGLLRPEQLHPLVAAALAPEHRAAAPDPAQDRGDGPRLVDCRGARHRIGLADGALVALDHGPEELRREELLVALGGTPLPCLQFIDQVHRRPDCLDGVRERLDHGDTAGALAVVERLLGPDALLRDGPLREELTAAAAGLVTHGLYRAGLVTPPHLPASAPRHPARRRPRHASTR